MSDNVQTAMFEILKSVQSSIGELRSEIADTRTGLIAKIQALEAKVDDASRRQRRDMAALLVMMKGTVGVFDERVSDVERRVTVLEGDKRT